MARLRTLLLASLAGLALAACGSAARSQPDPAGHFGSLTVTVRAKAGGAVVRTVHVDGNGPSLHPACERLAGAPGLLKPISSAERCTEIYAAAVATIAGSFGGEPVDLTVTRADGCNIERWAVRRGRRDPGGRGRRGRLAAVAGDRNGRGAADRHLADGVSGAVHHRYALGCEPVSGDLPDAAATCAKLAAVPNPATLFAPPNLHKECPRGGGNAVVGGPRRVRRPGRAPDVEPRERLRARALRAAADARRGTGGRRPSAARARRVTPSCRGSSGRRARVVRGLTIAKRVTVSPSCTVGVTNATFASSSRRDQSA